MESPCRHRSRIAGDESREEHCCLAPDRRQDLRRPDVRQVERCAFPRRYSRLAARRLVPFEIRCRTHRKPPSTRQTESPALTASTCSLVRRNIKHRNDFGVLTVRAFLYHQTSHVRCAGARIVPLFRPINSPSETPDRRILGSYAEYWQVLELGQHLL